MTFVQLVGVAILALSAPSASAQNHHTAMPQTELSGTPTEPGQGAFAAIAEIVVLLQSDPATDWERVNIENLRQHLIDMDNVTLRSDVMADPVPGGGIFRVTSPDEAVAHAIRRMVTAHAATIDGRDGRTMTAAPTPAGADLTVSGDDNQIRAFGFIGVMTVGMHHQSHHLAIATGKNVHE